jgi:hypothetical protein
MFMKRAFLVPTALAVAALSQAADAKISAGANVPAHRLTQDDASLAATRAIIDVQQKPITQYMVGDQLFGFVIERNESGMVVAGHSSHSSHASHASHASHVSNSQ